MSSAAVSKAIYFNPLPPHGGRPDRAVRNAPRQDISIHSLRMEGDDALKLIKVIYRISIHSLRMEGDNIILHSIPVVAVISIHSLRMEGDPSPLHTRIMAFLFQSTPSAWRETS